MVQVVGYKNSVAVRHCVCENVLGNVWENVYTPTENNPHKYNKTKATHTPYPHTYTHTHTLKHTLSQQFLSSQMEHCGEENIQFSCG